MGFAAPAFGVIDDARLRRRRIRRRGALAVVAIAAIAGAGVLVGEAVSSSGDGSPSPALVSALRVLRRPVTAADRLPAWIAADLERSATVFMPFVRRALTTDGFTFYVIPEISQSPFNGETVDGASLLALEKTEAHGGADASTITEINDDELTGTLGLSGARTLISGIVPNDVGSLTLRYAAGGAGGFSRKRLPAATIRAFAANNVIAITAPRGGLQARAAVATWRATNGAVIKVVHGTARRAWWLPTTR
jgi:hypothetical protein